MTYTAPTPDQLRAYLKTRGLSGSATAALTGLYGGQVVRKWLGGAAPTPIGYATLFRLAAEAVLTSEQVAAVHAEMERAGAMID